MTKKPNTTTVTIRINKKLLQRGKRFALATGRSLSALIVLGIGVTDDKSPRERRAGIDTMKEKYPRKPKTQKTTSAYITKEARDMAWGHGLSIDAHINDIYNYAIYAIVEERPWQSESQKKTSRK